MQISDGREWAEKQEVERQIQIMLGQDESWDDKQIAWYAETLTREHMVIDEAVLRNFARNVTKLMQWKTNVMSEFEEFEVPTDTTYLGGLYAKTHPNGTVEVQLQSPSTGGRNHVEWIATSETKSEDQ